MNRTLSIRPNTDAHQVFLFLEGVNRARNRLEKQGAVLVPDPSIRVRKKCGVAEFYVSEVKNAGKPTAASKLSVTKRAKRMKCARIMFGVARKFVRDHRLQNDQKAKAALASIKDLKDRTTNHDIKAGEMHALLESILRRPGEIATARLSTPPATETKPTQKTSCASAESPATDQVTPAPKKARRVRVKNFTRLVEAAALESSKSKSKLITDTRTNAPAPVLFSTPETQVTPLPTTSEANISFREHSPSTSMTVPLPKTENDTPVAMPVQSPPDNRSTVASSLPSKPRTGFLAFLSRMVEGLTQFFKSRFG